MQRQPIGQGKWFDKDTAEGWPEAHRFNGSNFISRATGTQWDHETLYLTASDAWVLHWRSDCQNSTERWEIIDAAEAVAWLTNNYHEAPPTLQTIDADNEV